ncbi:hypothetical protein [Methylococcus geothermalis]|uniref:Uncharacterized protein n=1 Tax=Methylococcus geothermalis TaxID=2681310 RepID=A0A858QAJ6_9GAMM|nr:hypothetical protein [Methylococcus geothermalis]QJD30860.1 hypothetical protein GNH96_13380 [Methylococcus geothermalis]
MSEPNASHSRNSESGHSAAAATEKSRGGHQPRFRIFILDTGWTSPAAQVIRDNFEMIRSFQDGDPLYVLSPEQSRDIVKRHPQFIGKDPVVIVRDMHRSGPRDGGEYHGFHLNLGLIQKPVRALHALQEFLRFLSMHRDSPNIEKDIRDRLHKDGFIGTIEVIREGAKDAMGA